MDFPALMKHRQVLDPLYIEYVRRTGIYNMAAHHFHPYYEVYYLLAGKRVYFIKDTSYTVLPGDLVFIPRYELHQTMGAGEAAHERIVFYFDERFIQEVMLSHAPFLLSPFQHPVKVVRLPEHSRPYADALIQRLLSEMHLQPVSSELFLRHALVDLLLLAARHLKNSEPSPIDPLSPTHQKISEVVRYLNDNYANTILIPELAKQFYISPYYLSRVFKEVTGFTLIDYINLTRIKEAQRLLRETKLKITEIAGQVGFGNFSHFGKVFKQITEASARDYRQHDPTHR